MKIKVDVGETGIEQREIDELRSQAGKALDALWSGREEMTGWVKTPLNTSGEDIDRILGISDIIKDEAQLLVVIGIGGSYLGAKAAIEALPKYEAGIPVRFLGNNLCTDYYWETIEEMKNRKCMVCVISKSGSTMEVKTAFEIVKPILVEQYGSEEEASKRIIVITDPQKGELRRAAEEKNYVSLEIPSDVGGRYSVLTPAGLLPMAVSGIDIRELVRGAADMANAPEWDTDATDYAIVRYLLENKGKTVEFVELCHSRLNFLGEWIKQLYGESEGKEGGGLLPATLTFSTDLHSMGQYLQQGRQMFMETILTVDEPATEIKIPEGPQRGKNVADLNRIVVESVITAHRGAGIPIVQIHIPELNAHSYGQLLYFFETTCAVTAMLKGINPFNQPGVEAYKAEMKKLC